MNLVVCGDSHTIALSRGFSLLADQGSFRGAISFIRVFRGVDFTLGPLFRVKDGRLVLTGSVGIEAAQQRFSDVLGVLEHPQEDTIFAVSLGLSSALLIRMTMWHTYCPWNVKPEHDEEVLSEAVLTKIILKHNEHVLGFYDLLRSANRKCIAISSPPMRLAEVIAPRRAPSNTLVAVNRLARAVMKERLEGLGVHVVMPPAEVVNETGFLRSEYDAKKEGDTHHANEGWGRLMLQRVLEEAADLAQR